MKHIRLTIPLLTERHACKAGKDWFWKVFPEGLLLDKIGFSILTKKLLLRSADKENWFNLAADNVLEDTLLALVWVRKRIFYWIDDERMTEKIFELYSENRLSTKDYKMISEAFYNESYNVSG